MREVPDRDGWNIITAVVDDEERPLVKRRTIQLLNRAAWTRDSTIVYTFAADNTWTEHEALENFAPTADGRQLVETKYVVREHMSVPHAMPLAIHDRSSLLKIEVGTVLTTLGHTEFGGHPDNPFEPWAHFYVFDPEDVARLFRLLTVHVDIRRRQPNAGGTYIEVLSDEVMTFTVPVHTISLPRRSVIIVNIGRVTFDLTPDEGGRPGLPYKATFSKVLWQPGR